MSSDDDMPLARNAGPKRTNGSAKKGANGHSNGKPNGKAKAAPAPSTQASSDNDVSMSSAEEADDVPLADSSPPWNKTPKSKAKSKRAPPPVSHSASSDDEDDDAPLASSQPRAKSAAVPMPGAVAATTVPAANGARKHTAGHSKSVVSDDEDDDVPLVSSSPAKPKPKKKSAAKRAKVESSDEETPKKQPRKKRKVVEAESEDDDDDDDDAPLVKSSPKKKAPAPAAAKKKVKKEETDEEDVKPAKGKGKASSSKGRAKKEEEEEDVKPKKGKGKAPKKEDAEEGDDDEDQYKWWEAQNKDDTSEKWSKLSHNGVLFPPPYVPLPKSVKMKYNGQDVDLPPESEEVAGFYAVLMDTDHAKDPVFNKNFFADWTKVLSKHPPRNNIKITDLEKCDFRPMFAYFEAERAKKKAMTASERKEAKKAKDEMEAPFATCVLDGRKEKIGNFRVEPPSLFRGRGQHPKKGCLKLRVHPEDITINIGEGEPTPKPNVPGNWKKVIHDNTVTWLATWTENVNSNNKYVFLAAGSSLKGQSDMNKFERARELKKHVDRIRQDYVGDLKSKVMADRQRATAMYFIDKLALRAGNEKGEDEADTVGCCSLRCEHVTLEQPNFIIFDFLGKDSIRYYKRVAVEEQVFKNIRIFKQNKDDDDNLFDRVTTTTLNKHLTSYMKGLTAKVFRTYNASITFQEQLDENTPKKASLQEKLNAYNKANRMVAILCNHQRSVPKTHEASMGKMRDKIRALKYEKMKLRHALCTLEPKYKKKAQYSTLESDIDEDWVAAHEVDLEAKELERVNKKFEKDNEKRAADGEPALAKSELDERVKAVKDDFKRLRKEQGTEKAVLKRERPAEKLEEGITKLEERIATAKLQMEDRDEGKEVALGTSKINYLDPRITASWCKEHDVPIEKIFSKTLLVKFPWALTENADWKF